MHAAEGSVRMVAGSACVNPGLPACQVHIDKLAAEDLDGSPDDPVLQESRACCFLGRRSRQDTPGPRKTCCTSLVSFECFDSPGTAEHPRIQLPPVKRRTGSLHHSREWAVVHHLRMGGRGCDSGGSGAVPLNSRKPLSADGRTTYILPCRFAGYGDKRFVE